MDLLAVQRCAFAARGGEQFIVKRVEDDSCDYRVPLRETYRDAKTWIAVRKVRRAVERIDVPAEFRIRGALVPRSLFRSDRMFGKILGQALDNGRFRTLVCLRHQVHVALVRNLRRVVKLLAQDLAGLSRYVHRCLQVVVAHQQSRSSFSKRYSLYHLRRDFRGADECGGYDVDLRLHGALEATPKTVF